MTEDLTEIRKHIERTVTHIAREHGVMDEVVWKQMLLASMEHTKSKKHSNNMNYESNNRNSRKVY